MGWRRWIDSLASPYVEVLRPIPPITFIPLSIAWFGFSTLQKVFLVFLGGLWPILLNARAGVSGVQTDLTRAGLMLGMSRRQLMRKVVLPAALPDIVTGAKIGIGTSSLAVFGAELAGAHDGVGWLTIRAAELLRPADVITGMIFIGAIGLALAAIFGRLERRLLYWHYLRAI
jgi:ABC-type nitrate/sulfonate/bicarbonate transport system permease component